jgi:hypothetical protein
VAGEAAKPGRQACKVGLERIVLKRPIAPYRSGPSRNWIEVKNPGCADPTPEYIAGLCRKGSELVPFDTTRISAEIHDEAVRQAVEWLLSSTNTTTDDSTWLQVLKDGSAIFSRQIGQL